MRFLAGHEGAKEYARGLAACRKRGMQEFVHAL